MHTRVTRDSSDSSPFFMGPVAAGCYSSAGACWSRWNSMTCQIGPIPAIRTFLLFLICMKGSKKLHPKSYVGRIFFPSNHNKFSRTYCRNRPLSETLWGEENPVKKKGMHVLNSPQHSWFQEAERVTAFVGSKWVWGGAIEALVDVRWCRLSGGKSTGQMAPGKSSRLWF